MPRLRAAATAVVLLAVFVAAADALQCQGYAAYPGRDAACRQLLDRATCLSGYSFQRQNISASCIWHFETATMTRIEQYIYNRGDSVIIGGLANEGNICANSMKIVLDGQAAGRWGTHMRLLGGPQNVEGNIMKPFVGPRGDMAMSGCTAGLGTPSTCRVKLVSPLGYAHDPSFYQSSAIVEFQTIDKKLVSMWKNNGRLDGPNSLKFFLTVYADRCTADRYPMPTPVIRDQIRFGSTNFFMSLITPSYNLVTFKAYRVTNLTGAVWTVGVHTSFAADKRKVGMTSMLLSESKYQAWAAQCKTNCVPPFADAFKGTLCTGIWCKRQVRGLKAATGTYRLLIAYPQKVSSWSWAGSWSNTSPLTWPFPKQLVNVNIYANSWKLAPAGDVFSGGEGARAAAAPGSHTLLPPVTLTEYKADGRGGI